MGRLIMVGQAKGWGTVQQNLSSNRRHMMNQNTKLAIPACQTSLREASLLYLVQLAFLFVCTGTNNAIPVSYKFVT